MPELFYRLVLIGQIHISLIIWYYRPCFYLFDITETHVIEMMCSKMERVRVRLSAHCDFWYQYLYMIRDVLKSGVMVVRLIIMIMKMIARVIMIICKHSYSQTRAHKTLRLLEYCAEISNAKIERKWNQSINSVDLCQARKWNCMWYSVVLKQK